MTNGRDIAFYQEKTDGLRRKLLDSLHHLGVGHLGGCLSVLDALAVVYYGHMRIDPSNPKLPGRDRLVMSKGHAGPAVYAVLADLGFFPEEKLHSLNLLHTELPSHCDMRRTPGVDMTTGSLGQGISCAVGIAAASRLANDGAWIYVFVGDGESQEGQVWEAAMYAGSQKLDHLIAFTDYNKMQIDGTTAEINTLEELPEKWSAFGWHTQRVDGHDWQAVDDAICRAKQTPGKPHMIVLDTIKGKGIAFVEQAGLLSHNMSFTEEQYQAGMAQLAE